MYVFSILNSSKTLHFLYIFFSYVLIWIYFFFCNFLATSKENTPNESDSFVSIIAGAGAGILVLMVSVVLMTYVITKRQTKKRLLRSSQRSDTSQESCEVR